MNKDVLIQALSFRCVDSTDIARIAGFRDKRSLWTTLNIASCSGTCRTVYLYTKRLSSHSRLINESEAVIGDRLSEVLNC